MPLICLVRHGQATAGALNYDELSEVGQQQATVLGEELARRGLRDPVIACGTLVRQRDTATMLADAAGLRVEPTVDSRWNEYDHLGLIRRYATPDESGPDDRDVQGLLDSALIGWISDHDGGWSTFSEGARTALEELIATLGTGRDGIVVTSGGVLAAVCGSLLSLPPQGILALNRVAVNAGITAVVAGRSGTTLLSFNEHAHFAGARRELRTYR